MRQLVAVLLLLLAFAPASALAGPASALAGPASALAGPASAVAGPASAVAAPDPRVAEADALLGASETFGRAVELYRAALAEAPAERAVRLRLARVLAWSQRYDEALAEYDRLLADSGPSQGEVDPTLPSPPELLVERAEVLSWAGRNDEAIAAFEAALARDPQSARAARGLARAYRWSGRKAPADRAYERALALEEDPEARSEWEALRAPFPPRAGLEAELYSDSEDFRELRSFATASAFPDLDTELLGRAGMIDVSGPRVAAAPWLEREDRGGEVAFTAKRSFGERVQGELELGARVFREAGAFPLARGRLQLTTRRGAVFGLEVDHRDALDSTGAVAALEDGIRDTTTRISLWKGLPHRFEVFTDAQVAFLSDSNLRSATGATLSWQPWGERELRLLVGGGYVGYTRSSELYYDPEWDASGFVGLSHREQLPHRLSVDLEARGGWGGARQDGVTGNGPAYEVAGSLAWRVGIVRLALRASRAQSQRESSYVANRIFATVGLDLGR
jgi:tetratricopeptide (TPR) repeat protein